jgi:hypothetical protein
MWLAPYVSPPVRGRSQMPVTSSSGEIGKKCLVGKIERDEGGPEGSKECRGRPTLGFAGLAGDTQLGYRPYCILRVLLS